MVEASNKMKRPSKISRKISWQENNTTKSGAMLHLQAVSMASLKVNAMKFKKRYKIFAVDVARI